MSKLVAFYFAVLLARASAACGGQVQPAECVAGNVSRDCSAGDVVVYVQTMDEAGTTRGVMTTCRGACPVGQGCTFPTSAGYVEGVCE